MLVPSSFCRVTRIARAVLVLGIAVVAARCTDQSDPMAPEPSRVSPAVRATDASNESPLVAASSPSCAGITDWRMIFHVPGTPGGLPGHAIWEGHRRNLVSSSPAFLVSDGRSVQNDLNTPISATFTSQVSKTHSITVTVGTSADLRDWLQLNVSTQIVSSRTTAIGVSATTEVPPHSRVLGEYGLEGFDVTYDVQTLFATKFGYGSETIPPSPSGGGVVQCQDDGTQRVTTEAPTFIEGWRFSAT